MSAPFLRTPLKLPTSSRVGAKRHSSPAGTGELRFDAEQALRDLVKAELGRFVRKDSPAVLVEEMEVCLGRARVDLAVIANVLIGIELKSVKDDVTRLADQAAAYSKCFDRVVLVLDESLLSKAQAIVPGWWGIVVSHHMNGQLTYDFERRPRPNPEQDLDALLALLWRDEIDALMADFLGVVPGPRATKKALRTQLMAGIQPDVLHGASLGKLRTRTAWRGVPIHT